MTASILPPSIADLKSDGVNGAVVSCTNCHRATVVSWADMRLDDFTQFPDVARLKRFGCSNCGSKAVTIMPDWLGLKPHGGS